MSLPRALVLVSLAGIAAAQGALAANWVGIGATSGGRLYMDAETLRVEKGYVRVWVREDLSAPERDEHSGKPFVRELTSFALDCEGRRYAITAGSRRDENGGEVSSFSAPADSWEFDEAVPDTIAAGVLNAACRAHRGDAEAGDAELVATLTDPGSWQLLGSGEHQGSPTELYILESSIQRDGDVGWAVLQVRFLRPRSLEGLPPAKFMVMRELVNCRSGLRAVGGMMLVGPEGETILPFHEEKSLDPRQVEFDSPAASVFLRICGGETF